MDATPTTSPVKKIQAVTMANDKLSGLSYREIAKKHNCSKMTVHRRLKSQEIKEFIEDATSDMISMLPLAIKTQYDALLDKDNKALGLKASENILKTGGVMPSNVQNQTITNIFNVQNNIGLNPTVAKSLINAFNNDDEDIIEAEIDG